MSSPLPAPRRRLRTTVEITVCLLTGAALWAVATGFALDQGPAPSGLQNTLLLLDVLAGLAASVVVPLLGRRPVANVVAVALISWSVFALPALVLALIRIGGRRSVRWSAAAVALTVAGNLARLVAEEWTRGPWRLEVLGTGAAGGLAALAVILWAQSRQTKALLLASLTSEAESARRERDAVAGRRQAELAAARARERTAIARDMHDTISHKLALVALHAGALAYRSDLTPEQQRRAAATARDAAAQAGSSLRTVLNSLREDSDSDRVPLPDWTSVADQVADARARGQRVNLITDGEELGLLHDRAPATSVALGRIVAELLINAAKHAPDARLTVRVIIDSDSVGVIAENAITRSADEPEVGAVGTGTGLIGAAERARLLGGTLSHGRAADGFRVEVCLPLGPRAAAGKIEGRHV